MHYWHLFISFIQNFISSIKHQTLQTKSSGTELAAQVDDSAPMSGVTSRAELDDIQEVAEEEGQEEFIEKKE